jgi:hypothetical protein
VGVIPPLSGPAPGGASRGCPCVAPLAMAACCTPTRVCTRLSRRAHCPIVCTRLSRRPSAAPRALQSFCIRLSKQCSSCLQPSPRAAPPSSPSRAGCPSPAPRPVRARRRGPAACRLPIGLASGSPHAPVRRGRAPGGAGGYGLAQSERTSERAAGGHGGDGHGRWKRRLIFLYSEGVDSCDAPCYIRRHARRCTLMVNRHPSAMKQTRHSMAVWWCCVTRVA